MRIGDLLITIANEYQGFVKYRSYYLWELVSRLTRLIYSGVWAAAL